MTPSHADELPAAPTCGWWIRWYHRRLRWVDRSQLLPSLYKVAVERGDPLWKADVAWDVYRATEAHWNCACAQPELAQEWIDREPPLPPRPPLSPIERSIIRIEHGGDFEGE